LCRPNPTKVAHTVDDEELQTTWKSAALLRLEHGGGGLTHSKSSTNLAAESSAAAASPSVLINGVGGSALKGKKKDVGVVDKLDRLVDCFFTLHDAQAETGW